ncbi:MAG: hypothetical protein COA44_06255 [Arcobacter sp.]|nr:MAG: hypothetical protein COA44_06255 [Arcobacter sp.]
MATETATDSRGVALQVFKPTQGKVLTATVTTAYVPTETETLKLANLAKITIDGIQIEYAQGEIIALTKGKSYTFDIATSAHVM